MLDLVGKRFWFFYIAGAISLVCIIALGIFGLKPGVEFSSGSMVTINFEKTVSQSDLEQGLTSLGYASAIVQRDVVSGAYYIRLPQLTDPDKAKLEQDLTATFGTLQESEFYSVSPMVASETARNAGFAVAISVVGILLYVAWAFRKMPSPFRYGTAAIIALVHDTLVATGVFAILGALLNWQVDLMFITGILAVIGYSVNNVVVVFDRIRENVTLGISSDFATIVNNSLVETLSRCLNTSLTTIFTLVALLLFVGASIQNFVVVLIIGVISGTFSSTCIAPTLLVVWENDEWGRFVSWLPLGSKARSG